MSRKFGDHIRSNVVGYLALFWLMTGTAWAVDGPLAGQDQVGTLDIINGEVKRDDLAANAVRTGTVIDNSLTAADLAPGAVGTPELQANSVDALRLKVDSVGYEELSADAFNAEITDTTFGDYGIADNSIDASEITNGAVASTEVLDQSLLGQDIGDNAINADEVQENSLGGGDVNEATLAPTASVFAASSGRVPVPNEGTVTVSSKQVPPGKYLVTASAYLQNGDLDDDVSFVGCALMKDGARIAGNIIHQGRPTGNGQSLNFFAESEAFSVQVPVNTATSANLGLFCGESGGGEVSIEWSSLTALEVASIG